MMLDNNKQPTHHGDTEWQSAYQRYAVGNFLWACNKHGDYGRMFKRWRKSIESGKHVPLKPLRLQQRQIELDRKAATLEREQHRMLAWSQKQEDQRCIELFDSLGPWSQLKCWWYSRRGQTLSQQLFSAVGISFYNYDRSREEMASHFSIDLDEFDEELHQAKDELRVLFWDAVFTQELTRQMRSELAQQHRIDEIAATRKRRKDWQAEKRASAILERSRRDLLLEKFSRADMLIRERDYKRGNTLENYFRNHLRDQVAAAFDNACVKCGKSATLALDHWAIPKNEGGNFLLCRADTRDLLLNVTVLCMSCNSSKGEARPVDWVGIHRAEEIDATLAKLMSELWQISKLRRVVMKWYELDLLELFLADQS